MAAASNWLEEAILNYFFRNQSVAQPTQIYLALYINDPTDADTGTEVSGGAYARQQITFGTPTQTGDKGVISNNQKIEFPIATTDWGNISHWGIRSAQTGGNLLCRGSFSRVENVLSGNRFTIETGNLQVTME
ncbi:MAG: hypothetical protein GX053_12585 [Tissierella sp.]|nr:hypothetical protein [Tissierella sp.]